SSSYQEAQLAQGNFAPDTISVGDLFAGALLPGLALVGLYLLYLAIVSLVRPGAMPLASEAGEEIAIDGSMWRHRGDALVPPLILIVAVLGSILGGIATPTEAAAVGAVGATMLAGYRLDSRRRWPILIGAASFVGLIVLTSFQDLRLQRMASGGAFWIVV